MNAVSFIQSYHTKLPLKPADLAEKYSKIKQDAFALFRIMPALFYADLFGRFAARAALTGHSAPRICIDGDMHLQNFGTFRGAAGGAVWGINDFDLCDIGSPEWDLARLATSVVLALRIKKSAAQDERELLEEMAAQYFTAIA